MEEKKIDMKEERIVFGKSGMGTSKLIARPFAFMKGQHPHVEDWSHVFTEGIMDKVRLAKYLQKRSERTGIVLITGQQVIEDIAGLITGNAPGNTPK